MTLSFVDSQGNAVDIMKARINFLHCPQCKEAVKPMAGDLDPETIHDFIYPKGHGKHVGVRGHLYSLLVWELKREGRD